MVMGGVEITGVADVADRAAVGTPAKALQFGDDFHGADFRCTGQRSGRKAGAQRVHTAVARIEFSAHVADDVDDVGKPLDDHQVVDVDGARSGDATNVIAAQVHKHHVLGALLRVSQEFTFELSFLPPGGPTGPGTRDGPSASASIDCLQEHLG